MGADNFGGNDMGGAAGNFGNDFGVGGEGEMDPVKLKFFLKS